MTMMVMISGDPKKGGVTSLGQPNRASQGAQERTDPPSLIQPAPNTDFDNPDKKGNEDDGFDEEELGKAEEMDPRI